MRTVEHVKARVRSRLEKTTEYYFAAVKQNVLIARVSEKVILPTIGLSAVLILLGMDSVKKTYKELRSLR